MSENLSKTGARDVNALAEEMHDAIVTLAGGRGWADTREAWLARAARRAGISYRRAKSFFYREVSNPGGNEIEAVRTALAKHKPVGTDAKNQDDTSAAELRRLVHEHAELGRRIAALDAAMRGRSDARPPEGAPRAQ